MRQLLIVPIFSWALFSLACQKKESDSSTEPEVASNTVNVSVQDPAPVSGQNSEPVPLPSSPEQPGTPSLPPGDPERPSQAQPAPTEGVSSLKIISEGAFIVGHKKLLKAMARYTTGTQREVPAQWDLVSNEADASLEADGSIKASKTGKVVVRAQFSDKAAEATFIFQEPMLRHRENQFWVYRLNREFLSFNSPWDKEAGHGITRLPNNVPDYGRSCLEEARQRFSEVQEQEEVKGRIGELIANGATAQLIFLVNVVPVDGRRNDLRRLDRDAYFWHWNRESERPSLAMSRFKEGSWVWEVIASPGECLQPDETEIQRYLNYVAARLALVQ
ncbi:hypothetical protein [Oligoflexus tunisiensis]|uniref:hypothetical protein n=1 Tax=Oligoflexus tunisiensis TaxID=708132 RepID=UPI00114CAF2F|nr:hypothetical protein [Oligoflexus tunisiensis]